MFTCTLLICIGIALGIFALISILAMGGAVLTLVLDLVILGFAVYGFIKFIEWYRNR